MGLGGELEDLGARDLKGITGPVQAWAALRPSSVESRFDALHSSGVTELVGRLRWPAPEKRPTRSDHRPPPVRRDADASLEGRMRLQGRDCGNQLQPRSNGLRSACRVLRTQSARTYHAHHAVRRLRLDCQVGRCRRSSTIRWLARELPADPQGRTAERRLAPERTKPILPLAIESEACRLLNISKTELASQRSERAMQARRLPRAWGPRQLTSGLEVALSNRVSSNRSLRFRETEFSGQRQSGRNGCEGSRTPFQRQNLAKQPRQFGANRRVRGNLG